MIYRYGGWREIASCTYDLSMYLLDVSLVVVR
jgi:hypothetical protein